MLPLETLIALIQHVGQFLFVLHPVNHTVWVNQTVTLFVFWEVILVVVTHDARQRIYYVIDKLSVFVVGDFRLIHPKSSNCHLLVGF